MTVTRYYVTSDAMGSATAILDEDGNVLERRSYEAFGEMASMTPDGTPVEESPTGLDVGFQGQILDGITTIYQMGYRWYNPTLGRWLSRDPIGLEGGGNLCSFAANNALDNNDVFGLSPIEATVKWKLKTVLLKIDGNLRISSGTKTVISTINDPEPKVTCEFEGRASFCRKDGSRGTCIVTKDITFPVRSLPSMIEVLNVKTVPLITPGKGLIGITEDNIEINKSMTWICSERMKSLPEKTICPNG
jgi:RHS repeat-associated protein